MASASRSADFAHRALAPRRLLACLLVFLTFMGTTSAWHADDADPDCATAITGHDHAAHHERLSRQARTEPPYHCAICHWLQGFRTDSVAAAAAADRDRSKSPALALTTVPRQFLIRVDVPSRAPPARFS